MTIGIDGRLAGIAAGDGQVDSVFSWHHTLQVVRRIGSHIGRAGFGKNDRAASCAAKIRVLVLRPRNLISHRNRISPAQAIFLNSSVRRRLVGAGVAG
ncbi:MAG: hypothetical protein ABIT83_20685 [Massilia sp.]